MSPVTLEVLLEKKQPGLAAFVVIPAPAVAAWRLSATTTVEGTLDGVPLGRRSLVRWDDDRWFVELRQDHLAAIGKAPGERATLAFSVASAELPAELQSLIDGDPEARARWEAHTPAQQRMLREEILGAKTAATRERRARRALLPAERPIPARVDGLGPTPRRILLRIVGRRLPGTRCGPYRDIRVGLAQKVGHDPQDGVPADLPEAAWETQIEIREQDGRPAFRGPAVNGPPGERFVYLTWTGRQGAGPQAMFRLEAVVSWLPPCRDARLDLTSPMAGQASPFVRRVERMLAADASTVRRPSRAWLIVPLIAVIAAAPAVSGGRSGGAEPAGNASVQESAAGGPPRWSSGDLARTRGEARIYRPSPLPSLEARWSWALAEAASRNLGDFWIVYAFHTPIHAGQLMMSDSEGLNIVTKRLELPGRPSLAAVLAEATPIAGQGDVAVLVHYRAARAGAFDRAGYRSMELPYELGRAPVFWLGSAEEARSFSQVEALFAQSANDKLRTLFIEAASLHPTTDLVLPFLQRLLDPAVAANSVEVRSEAAEGFEHHHDPRSVRILLATARTDPSTKVRAEAAETIGEVQVPESIPALLELVRSSGDREVRQEAAEGFEDQPAERALPAIEELLAESLEDNVAMEVVESLGAFPGRESFDLLSRTAESHPRPRVQQEAVETLGDTETEGDRALEALLRIARESRNRTVQMEAVETLGEVHADGAEAALVRLIWEHPDPEAQSEAVETLGDLPGNGAVPELKRVLRQHPNEQVREEARETLADKYEEPDEEQR